MKLLIFILALLPLTLNAAANPPKPRQDIPEMDWVVRPMVRGGAVLPVKALKRAVEQGIDTAKGLADQDKIAKMIQSIGDTIVHFANISEEQAAMEVIDASFALLDAQKDLNNKQTLSAGGVVSFVIYPSSVEALETALPVDDFKAFKDQVFAGMKLQQDVYLSAPDNDHKWYFLGALGNLRASSKVGENDVHMQLVLGLKGQTRVQGENTIVVPTARAADEMTVAIVDISMPIDFTFPQVQISFGTLGELQPASVERSRKNRVEVVDSEWRLKFAPNPGVACSRAWSVPQVKTTMYHVALNVPVYSVTVDGNEQLLSDASAGLGGFGSVGPFSFEQIGCGFDIPYFKTISGKVKARVNAAITNSMFRDILGLSLRELSERVKALKEQEATKTSQN